MNNYHLWGGGKGTSAFEMVLSPLPRKPSGCCEKLWVSTALGIWTLPEATMGKGRYTFVFGSCCPIPCPPWLGFIAEKLQFAPKNTAPKRRRCCHIRWQISDLHLPRPLQEFDEQTADDGAVLEVDVVSTNGVVPVGHGDAVAGEVVGGPQGSDVALKVGVAL